MEVHHYDQYEGGISARRLWWCRHIDSVSILDSSFTNVGTAVVVNPVTSTPGMGSTGVALENVALSRVTVSVADTTSATLLAVSSALINEWAVGPV